ncbi:hypothetical protein GCM10010435_06270 [Winogradskya consettensis]|uniref:Uncharacterized protein n=1 Tax=Winogradskya consettensis TaxID=113560 RepID=A0A919VXG9_9ACTN|nr:hypothetical protein [Actinoplanes consettensis]GIM79362.1 hypothetical protein Aco04nite_65100 [Actinoplanes consettensis]
MTEQAPDRLWSGIQISKVVAGTLAAIAAAVLGSFLGVAGTLAGAALASVVGSVGTEIFNNSLKRGTKTLQTVAPTFIRAPAAIGTPAVAAASEEDNPAHTVPDDAVVEDAAVPAVKPRQKIRWGHIGLAAAVLFALSMGSISIIEAFTKKPLSASVTGSTATGSTVFGHKKSSDTTDEKPSTETSTAPSEAPADGTDPAEDPSTASSAEPTSTATSSAPEDGPTTEPTTDAPQPDSTGGTGDQSELDGTQQQDSSGSGSGAQQELAPAPQPSE